MGQNKIPNKITGSSYAVKKVGENYEIGEKKFSYDRFFDKEGNDITSERMGIIRNPDILKYDERGNVIDRASFSGDETLLWRSLYTYDDFDRVIEIRSVDEHSNLITIDEIEYDKEGNKIRTEKLDADGTSILKTIYRYDTVNNQVFYTEYKKGQFYIRYTHRYDLKNNLIEKQWIDTIGRCYSRTLFEYTDKNEPLREITYDGDGQITHKKVFDYVFDQYGSWTERREYINDQLTDVIMREITYYD